MEPTTISSESVKLAVNNLLWMYLPAHINMEQAEQLALKIHDIVYNPQNHIK